MKSRAQRTTILILRWIAFLPTGFLASIVSFYVVYFLNAVTMARYVEPSSMLGQLFSNWLGSCISGAAFVFVATYVVPSNRKRVAIIVAAIILFLSGGAFLIALGGRYYWGMFRYLAFNVGSIAIAYLVAVDQIEVFSKSISANDQQGRGDE